MGNPTTATPPPIDCNTARGQLAIAAALAQSARAVATCREAQYVLLYQAARVALAAIRTVSGNGNVESLEEARILCDRMGEHSHRVTQGHLRSLWTTVQSVLQTAESLVHRVCGGPLDGPGEATL